MITKKMKQSSRSYKERQAMAAQLRARAPQIYKKELKVEQKTILGIIASMLMGFKRKKVM